MLCQSYRHTFVPYAGVTVCVENLDARAAGIGRLPTRPALCGCWSSAVAPPGFCNRGGVRYGSIGGLQYEVPQSRWYCLCINVALCSTALQCICRVIRRSSMTMKAHTYYIIFGRPPIGGKAPPWRRHCLYCLHMLPVTPAKSSLLPPSSTKNAYHLKRSGSVLWL